MKKFRGSGGDGDGGDWASSQLQEDYARRPPSPSGRSIGVRKRIPRPKTPPSPQLAAPLPIQDSVSCPLVVTAEREADFYDTNTPARLYYFLRHETSNNMLVCSCFSPTGEVPRPEEVVMLTSFRSREYFSTLRVCGSQFPAESNSPHSRYGIVLFQILHA